MEAAPAPAAPAAEVTQHPAPGAVPAPAAAPETPPEAPKPERVFSQAELDEIVEKRLAKERRKRDELRAERDVLRKLALREDQPPKPAEPEKPQTEGEPTRDQHPDISYEDFVMLRAEWRADRKAEAKFKEREDADRQRAEREKQESASKTWRKSMKESAKDLPDFDEVIGEITKDSAVGSINADMLMAADSPGKILYHLAKHPEDAERIAALPMGQQAREIVRLEEKLKAAPVKPSKAPEPISPVGGAKATPGDEMPDASKQPEKWLEWRNRTLAKAKGARA